MIESATYKNFGNEYSEFYDFLILNYFKIFSKNQINDDIRNILFQNYLQGKKEDFFLLFERFYEKSLINLIQKESIFNSGKN